MRGLLFSFGGIMMSFVLVACTGRVGDVRSDGASTQNGGTSGEGGSSSAGHRDGGSKQVAPPDVAPLPLRRLTALEFDNTVRDLLGTKLKPSDLLPRDDLSETGFSSALGGDALTVRALGEVADALSVDAMLRPGFLGCVPTTATLEADCAGKFIASFGRRAFRRSLSSSEANELFALFTTVRSESATFSEAMQSVLTAILQSPQFLYRWEVTDQNPESGGPPLRLPASHLASQLSYFLWATMPDDVLLDASESGALDTSDGIRDQVARMLADRRARDGVASLFGQTFALPDVLSAPKDSKRFPNWTDNMRLSALQESLGLIQTLLLEDRAPIEDILTTSRSFPDTNLIRYYGSELNRNDSQNSFELPERPGLLTRPAFLAGQSAPADGAMATAIHRGLVIRKRLLCQSIPPPPNQVNGGRVDSNGTARQKLAQHKADASCASCHSLFDDIGLTFEHYDVIGGYRKDDGGLPIDTIGVLDGLGGEPIETRDPASLAKAIAGTPEFAACMGRSVLRFGSGRLESDGEIEFLMGGEAGAPKTFQDWVAAIAQSDGFTHRRP